MTTDYTNSGITLHPSVAHVLQYFEYSHLPETLQPYSKRFRDLAYECAYCNPESPETTVALRKLLEAKDAAIRATLPKVLR